MKIYCILLCRHVLWLKFCLHTRYSIQNYFKHENKNKMIIIENMLSMQTKKLSSGQIFWILSKTGENIFVIYHVIKWNLFQRKAIWFLGLRNF